MTPKPMLKCLCNDESQCPSSATDVNTRRFCFTSSVCFTKRLRRVSDNTEFLKYYCNESLGGIREHMIEYNDCKINTTYHVQNRHLRDKLSEYCCDHEDFCNEHLNPTKAIKFYDNDNPIFEDPITTPNNPIFPGVNDSQENFGVFSSMNIFLLSLLILSTLVVLTMLIVILVKRYRNTGELKLKKNKNEASVKSEASSTKTKLTSTTTGLIPSLKENNLTDNNLSCYPTKNRNEYLSSHQDKVITAVELFEPLIQPKTGTRTGIETLYMPGKNTKALDSDFCTTSNCFTNTTSGGRESTLSSSQTPNVYSTQGSASAGFEWSGSGSGAGVPQLLPRTISRQIKLIYPCIGKGRFGEVYRGLWRDENVAVKTFNSADEKSWENECTIYNTSGFRHENILGFIASDNIDRGTYTELWIITEYHANGSLHDYLSQSPPHQLAPADTLRMALSIVNGLDHLHTAIESCQGKPALAHCDMKSKNILVKADLTCCISDLGLALSGDKNGQVTQPPHTIRTGTKRYMAPEILDKSINYRSLLEFQQAEMYSLALIFWELLRRTSFDIESDGEVTKVLAYEYRMPYYDFASTDPDEMQMRQLVCDQERRPEINPLWRQVTILNDLTQLTEELWVGNANGRLNALRLKKSLNQIKRKLS